jgi:AraC-like DNA-binding protein
MGAYPQHLPTLSDAGVGPAEYANPDTRIPHRLVMELLNRAVEKSGDPAIGLRVGERTEPGDFDALEFAVRSCLNVRESVHCGARHIRLIHDAGELTLVETGEAGIVRYRVTDGVLHFAHGPVDYQAEYARFFRSKIVFNAPHNAVILPRDFLDAPMVAANPRVSAAFELHVQKLLNGLQQSRTMSDRVRGLIVAQLSHGDVGMGAIARKLAMSVPTLRRRLEAEGITYSEIVDKSREALARRYLREHGRSITDVVFLLGFSDVPSFHKAFRRWTGMTPAEYRTSEANGATG